MCGRYALSLHPGQVRQQLQQAHMPVDEAPDDEVVRQSYNFAPGYHGLVYRSDGPDQRDSTEGNDAQSGDQEKSPQDEKAVSVKQPADTKYKLQSMKWGLIPFWTKRNPDYGSMLKTINCRDDSLYEDRGMWTSMKKKKRCIVVAEGFYEWLKKNNGKDRIPYFTKRKDGQLMCFAGLWDCVKYEDSDELHYTYTIITTESNKDLKFLHDRMPVILENGSEAIRTWLDPNRTEWSKDLQNLLKPFEGKLECYQVSKDVNKVGGADSPSFVVPIDSVHNKNNIMNFFGNQSKTVKAKKEEDTPVKDERDSGLDESMNEIKHDVNDTRATTSHVEGTETNAPLPVPANRPLGGEDSRGVKRERSEEAGGGGDTADGVAQQKPKLSNQSPKKSTARSPAKKANTRSATSNGSAAKVTAGKGNGSRKITSFFGNK